MWTPAAPHALVKSVHDSMSQAQWFYKLFKKDFYSGCAMEGLVRNGDKYSRLKGNLVRVQIPPLQVALVKGEILRVQGEGHAALARGTVDAPVPVGGTVVYLVPGKNSGDVGTKTAFKKGKLLHSGAGANLGKIVRVDALVRIITGADGTVDPRMTPKLGVAPLATFDMMHRLSSDQRHALWLIDFFERCYALIRAARAGAGPVSETLLKDVICEIDLKPGINSVGIVPNVPPFSAQTFGQQGVELLDTGSLRLPVHADFPLDHTFRSLHARVGCMGVNLEGAGDARATTREGGKLGNARTLPPICSDKTTLCPGATILHHEADRQELG